MVSLEQVKLLESKVAKAIDYVQKQSEENALLREKLEGYRSRIDELEVLVQRFKVDQGRIEAGIISALNRINQFEDAIDQGLSSVDDSPSLDQLPEDEESRDLPLVENEEKSEAEEGTLSQEDEDILAALEAEEKKAKEAAQEAAQEDAQEDAEGDAAENDKIEAEDEGAYQSTVKPAPSNFSSNTDSELDIF